MLVLQRKNLCFIVALSQNAVVTLGIKFKRMQSCSVLRTSK
jgi:hypothetical protein